MSIRPLPISRPCHASFAEMQGDEQTRFCEGCKKHVYDLSARTEPEARALLNDARGTRICVRYAKDGAGGIRFRAVSALAAVSLAACSASPSNHVARESNHAGPMTSASAPAPDYDMGDAIPDSNDRCPDPLEASDGGPPPEDGCPTAEPVPPKKEPAASH